MIDRVISLNLKDAAKATGIAPRTLQQMAKAGTAPGHRIGRRYVFPIEKLRAWIGSAPTQHKGG